MVSFSKKLGPPRPKFHAMPLSSRTPKFGIEGMSYCLSCMRDSFRSGPLEMVNFLPRECVLHICMRTTWLFLPFQNIARRAPVRRFPVHTHPQTGSTCALLSLGCSTQICGNPFIKTSSKLSRQGSRKIVKINKNQPTSTILCCSLCC